MSGTIICGSKGYKFANFDLLVDLFDDIVRVNYLIQGCGFGQRPASLQVVNHAISRWLKGGKGSVFLKKMPSEHIERFKAVMESTPQKHYQMGNHPLLVQTLRGTPEGAKIASSFGKAFTRTGLAHAAQLISENKKPFLIGFSLRNDNGNFHKFIEGGFVASSKHNTDVEHAAILHLHKRGLLDASFCALKDQIVLEFDESLLKPTPQAKVILESLPKPS
jgi:hypothetical protein